MSEQEQRFSSQDEISLIDLIAVLVRFRRMIVVGVVVVAVVAIAVLWGLPLLGAGGAPTQMYTTQLEIDIGLIPSAASQYLPTELSELVLAELQDAHFVAPIFDRYRRELNAYAPEFDTNPEYVRYVREQVIDNAYQTSWNGMTSRILLSYSSEDPESGEAFLQELATSLPAALQPTITRQTESSREIIRRTLANVRQSFSDPGEFNPSSSDRDVDANAQVGVPTLLELVLAEESLHELNDRLSDFISPAGQSTVVAVSQEARSRSVTLVLVVVAATFFFILAAFVRQYVHNVSRDPEEMAKLKAAWRRSDPDEQ